MKTHRYFQVATISFALVFANSAPAFCQSPQNNPAPSSQIQRVKDEVQKIGMGEDVTVKMISGLEYYGAISKIEPESFEIAEADLKQMVTITYSEVLKVEKGYGAMNSSTGTRHKGSRSFMLVWIVGVGAMIGLTVWAFKKLGRRQTARQPFPRFP
jgi:exopolysaccharide biosynthesis protein